LRRSVGLAGCRPGVAARASPAPAGAPHAAACIAALKAAEAELAESVKAGEPREPVLLKVVRSGIAIIGTQYLAGVQRSRGARAAQGGRARLPGAVAGSGASSARRPA
jgi:hypothetical protein